MSQENVEMVRKALDDWRATGEPNWSHIAEDVEIFDHDLMDATEFSGHDGALKWLENWGGTWEEFDLVPEELLDAGDRVVAFVRMIAKGRGGVQVERPDAIVYQLRDGFIVRLDYFNNHPEALAFAGLDS